METDCRKTVDKLIRKMPGKCGPDGMRYLCQLARDLKAEGWLIDLGTYHGRSAFVLVQASLGSQKRRKVITIDNYTEGPDAKDPSKGDPPDFWVVRQRLKCRGRAHMVYGDVADVPMICQGQDIALVFVDADHTRDGVTACIEAWKPLVVVGGVMVFDDYGNDRWPDVQPTVDELMADWERLEQHGSVVAFRRKD
jgi:cephalosporin hydroxylase